MTSGFPSVVSPMSDVPLASSDADTSMRSAPIEELWVAVAAVLQKRQSGNPLRVTVASKGPKSGAVAESESEKLAGYGGQGKNAQSTYAPICTSTERSWASGVIWPAAGAARPSATASETTTQRARSTQRPPSRIPAAILHRALAGVAKKSPRRARAARPRGR
jgi:hypothetical protein